MQTSVFVGTSLDGFIARKNGSYDFLSTEPVDDNGYEEFLGTVDAVVIGRKTFETVLSFDEWPYGNRFVAVLSTTLRESTAPAGAVCELMNLPPTRVIAELTRRGWKHVYIDGGATVQGFLREGLIQEITICRYPVLIGSGVPIFGWLPKDVRLELLSSRSYPSGMLKTQYRVRS